MYVIAKITKLHQVAQQRTCYHKDGSLCFGTVSKVIVIST